MPTYDYQCQACNHTWELFQSMNDSPISTCPKCKKRKAKRLLGLGAGIIFKGSGFYETDYKKKDSGKKEGNSSEKTETKDKGNSDKKSNSTKDTKKNSVPQKDSTKTTVSK